MSRQSEIDNIDRLRNSWKSLNLLGLYGITFAKHLVNEGIGTKDRFEIEVIPRGIGHNGMEMYKTNIQPINYEEDK